MSHQIEESGYAYFKGIHGFTHHEGGHARGFSWWRHGADPRVFSTTGGRAVTDYHGNLVKINDEA